MLEDNNNTFEQPEEAPIETSANEETPENFAEQNADTLPEGIKPYEPFVSCGYTEQTYKAKKGLKKTGIILGVPLIVLYFVMTFFYTIFALIAAAAGISYESILNFANEPAMAQVMQILISTLAFLLPFTLAVKFAGMRISDLVPLEKPKKGAVLPYLFFGLGFCAFANIATSFAGGIFESFGVDYSVSMPDNPSGFFGFMLSVIATAIVPALIEEFVCRGIILGTLEKYGTAFAVITSSIIFGLLHGNFIQMPFALLVGLALGFVRVKTGSLWVCVLIHFCNNLLSVLMDYASPMLSGGIQNVIYTVVFMLFMLLGVLGIVLIVNRGEIPFKKADDTVPERNRYLWFFTSPLIIITIILNFSSAVAYFFR